jgi:tRNA 2-thiouridine synthesizing protein A
MVDKKVDDFLDCSGLCCSLPLVEARSQLDKMKIGETLEVVATCPSSKKDIAILTSLDFFELINSWENNNKYYFLIKKIR